MQRSQLEYILEHSHDDYLEFDRIELKFSMRPDLHAFILLDSLVPGKQDIISAAEHDQYWLDIDLDQLASVISERDVIDLVRCGVRLDEEALSLFT
jgi:hypothetical protein